MTKSNAEMVTYLHEVLHDLRKETRSIQFSTQIIVDVAQGGEKPEPYEECLLILEHSLKDLQKLILNIESKVEELS